MNCNIRYGGFSIIEKQTAGKFSLSASVMMRLLQTNRLLWLLVASLLYCGLGVSSAETVSSNDAGRRLAADNAANPFMDTICSDMIGDSSLQIGTKDVSIVIVARNEGRSAFARTVIHILSVLCVQKEAV